MSSIEHVNSSIHKWCSIILAGIIVVVIHTAPLQAEIGNTEVIEPTEVLLFTKTAGFRHDIIESGSEVIKTLGSSNGFRITSTEDPGVFIEEKLAGYQAIIFFNSSGEVLNDSQKSVFQNYIRNGGGFVGIHQGITTHQNWNWFLDMVGGGIKFKSHPGVKEGVVVRLEDANHPSTNHLSAEWIITEEIHNYTVNPRAMTNVLLNIDESSYEGGEMGDHPISWYHMFEGGRVWATGLGHSEEIFRDINFHNHLIGGIHWAAGMKGPQSSEISGNASWWSSRHSVRIPIMIGASGHLRFDAPAEVDINFSEVLQKSNILESFDKNSLHLLEINSQGKILDESVPFQFDSNGSFGALADARSGTIIFNLRGRTPENSVRRYHLYIGTDADGSTVFSPPAFIQQVVVADDIFHRNQESFKITTCDALGRPNTTYYYHKLGGGFASMYDFDGNDWLDYNPGGGDKGEWRGIPNLGWDNWDWENPDNDPGFGHPDYTSGQSEIIHQGPLKTTIRSWSNNEFWETYWEIYSTFARLTVTKVPDREYWFLYEGPPGGGGELDPTDLFVRDDGYSSPTSEAWAGDLEWGYFTSKKSNRSLYLVHEDHRNHDYREASYWRLNTMTVFGFGRGSGDNRLTPLFTETPNRFIIGFTEGIDYTEVSQVVRSALEPLSYRVDPPQVTPAK